ncbi:GMC family oxidoreductase [Microbulbifer sp. OS29]|uniref:GMC family oxidoreductase n=1 Tax=Microbulbifer okhotskensis TaxID=2926617 RepID=A0A9X2ESK3_9GAMM|nr:GMC family oxidoreductase [Microbulbifer okhotskensis]MCO1334988.1 GMC family oxidoreductase [Microbulbifer okhotskensis]
MPKDDFEKKEYDILIVGSGAGGGMAAYVLATAGLKVLMLEAGRSYDPIKETPMFNLPKDAPLRGGSTPEKPFGFYDATVDGGWQVPGEPYTQASNERGQRFDWWRARMLGGRTNHWGRISLRMGEYDFKPHSRDGLGFDWPISYQELAPYYDKTEMLIGVYGTNEGLENTPDSSDGVLLPPPKPRAYELLAKKSCDKLGIPVIPSHLAILSERLDHENIPQKLFPNNKLGQSVTRESMKSRAACFWATPCGRGCSIKANFQSTTVLLPPAMATGNLDIITDAMVREVTIDKKGQANGVLYVDKNTRQERFASARAVVVAASAAETSRILLNSKSTLFPDGLANGSGVVGKYLMDTVGAGIGGQIPALENMPAHNEDGASAMHMYMPWWLYKEQLRGDLDFARGYHIEFGGGRSMPGAGAFGGMGNFTKGAYGKDLKEACRRYYGSFVWFDGRGEMIPNEDSYCEIDKGQVDQWGIPVLKFHWKWSEHELNQAAHMHKTFAGIIDGMGGKVTSTVQTDGAKAIINGGAIIHEVGTARMGNNPKNSVLNPHCQSWEVSNLFLTDGAPFVSNADKNPTLTIMALAWRTCDYIVDQFKKRNI